MIDHSQLKARPDASSAQINNIRTWLYNNNGAIKREEIKFVGEDHDPIPGDLMPVVPRQRTPLRRFIDRYQISRILPCFRERKVRPLNASHACKVDDD